ncbi:MAG: hypothetical protein WD823_12190 [Sulfuricaulis sp.]|uniref:DNA methylase n=1 Tax=Sulfuricaulis sp. TaxID=2003553 RepID=UPI0034A23F27
MKKRNAFATAMIINPKRYADVGGAQEARLFPYYAGYSAAFASTLLASLDLSNKSSILDPWNGSGITTHTARRFGYKTIGLDLNPVMVLVARAELLSPQDVGRLVPLAHRILDKARKQHRRAAEDDPLTQWLAPTTASFMRAIEIEINSSLVSNTHYKRLINEKDFNRVSALAAFFYLVLFGVARGLLKKFKATNPMWIKSPAKPHQRTKANKKKVKTLFLDEVGLLSGLLAVHSFSVTDRSRTCSITLGNSESMPLKSRSISMVLTSPPYCTRIDYAMATAVELAVLGFNKADFDTLRRSLMGTSTVSARNFAQVTAWGETSNRFLDKLYSHASKASKTYYFKNHLQYFASLYASIREISRVLKRDGKCAMVVQDSYYKDIRNDVPKMVIEMARAHGLVLQRQETFVSGRSMVGMNRKAREYISGRKTKESVLCFVRT